MNSCVSRVLVDRAQSYRRAARGKRFATFAVVVALGFALVACRPFQRWDAAAERYMTFGGVHRSYRVHVGGGARAGRPLVLVLHGMGGSSEAIERRTSRSFDRLADRDGAVIVYPDALGAPSRWSDGWGEGGLAAGVTDDVGFLAAIIERLVRDEGVDPKRVFSAGFSNGASMVYRLACDRPNLIAAIAPVSGGMALDIMRRCAAGRPIPLLAMHGTEDPMVPLDRELRAGVAAWVRRDGCNDAPTSVTPLPDADPGDGTRTRIERYAPCAAGGEVSFYEIEGGGHAWPGGTPPFGFRNRGRSPRDFDAADAVWAFFLQHPMP